MSEEEEESEGMITCVEHLHELCIRPILDVIVRPIVYLHLDGVPPVVHDEDQGLHSLSYHGSYFLSCELERAVPDHGNHPATVVSVVRVSRSYNG